MPSGHWGQLRSINAGAARVVSAAGVAFEGVLTVIVSGPWQRALQQLLGHEACIAHEYRMSALRRYVVAMPACQRCLEAQRLYFTKV